MQARYQYGDLRIRKRKKGPDVWQYRYIDDGRRKSVLVGTVEKLPTKADAERTVEHIRIKINAQNPQKKFHSATVGGLIDRFAAEHMPQLRKGTRQAYASLFKNHIRPRWGTLLLGDVKPMDVKNWLASYPHSRQIKSHIKGLMHGLFQAAMLWEMIDKNPISLVRQSCKRLKTPRRLTPAEIRRLVAQLEEPYRTMVLTVACLGLRAGELTSLQWGDLDFLNSTVKVERSVVQGEINLTKTPRSEDILPLDLALGELLKAHRLRSVHLEPTDFVFAGQSGRFRWSNQITKDYIKPAAARAGIRGPIGWPTFRHSYSTLLRALGTDIKVQQELLRHSNVAVTLNVYTEAISQQKREAAGKVAAELLAPGEAEQAPTGTQVIQ